MAASPAEGKVLIVPLSLAAFVVGVWLAGQIGSEFLPKVEDGCVMVKVMMGGITSQGVVLLTLAEDYRKAGLSPLDTVTKATPIRLRPILMTQLATVLGLLPLALNRMFTSINRQ